VAALSWVPGESLGPERWGRTGEIAEQVGAPQLELVRSWLGSALRALEQLHRRGWIHGDISPGNLIFSGGDLALIDFDCSVRIGDPRVGFNPQFSLPIREGSGLAAPEVDLYALGASFFALLYGVDPSKGLDARAVPVSGLLPWGQIPEPDREFWRPLEAFLRRCCEDGEHRFRTAEQASYALQHLESLAQPGQELERRLEPLGHLEPKQVPWLEELLSGYPGSLHGNRETRGLDSRFAEQTYVPTSLDEELLGDLQRGDASLVLLFGNAGDGKTAFLQHLLRRLGFTPLESAQRVQGYRLPDGRELLVNLDGSAAYGEKSSRELLDDFFAPFHQPPGPGFPKVRLIAINSGPLKQWATAQPDGWLKSQLLAVLAGDLRSIDPALRLIDLNARSLVGHYRGAELRSEFLDQLLDRMLGPEETWAVCPSCSAQNRCSAWASVQALRSDAGPGLRRAIWTAFQAVHQRGRVHITARELRGALSYAVFGLHRCQDLHQDPNLQPDTLAQRLFAGDSAHRQGELLGELAQLDPALGSDPQVDRELVGGSAQAGPDQLAARRRQAYLEGRVALHRGEHLERFLGFPQASPAQRRELTDRLLAGISALQPLPRVAKRGGLALRMAGRQQTETVFWAEKQRENFSLEMEPSYAGQVEQLHQALLLCYRRGERREQLRLTTDLFAALLDLAGGAQLPLDATYAEIYANLEIFIQRLTSDEERNWRAWIPADPQAVYQLMVVSPMQPERPSEVLLSRALPQEDPYA
jgi:hypothetical protein